MRGIQRPVRLQLVLPETCHSLSALPPPSECCGVDWRPSCLPSCPSLKEAWAQMKGPENTQRHQRALILEIDSNSLCVLEMFGQEDSK